MVRLLAAPPLPPPPLVVLLWPVAKESSKLYKDELKYSVNDVIDEDKVLVAAEDEDVTEEEIAAVDSVLVESVFKLLLSQLLHLRRGDASDDNTSSSSRSVGSFALSTTTTLLLLLLIRCCCCCFFRI